MVTVGKMSEERRDALRVLSMVLARYEESPDGARSVLGPPRVCASLGQSLRHLAPLCRRYTRLLADIRAEFVALLTDEEVRAEELVHRTVSLQAKATELLHWDAVLERSRYVEPVEGYRHRGRSLGMITCRRLAHCAASAVEDPSFDVRAIVRWLAEPAWFKEVRADVRSARKKRVLAVVLVLAAAGAGYFAQAAIRGGWLPFR